MPERPRKPKQPHRVWRLLAIALFVGLFVLGVAMVFRQPAEKDEFGRVLRPQTATAPAGTIPRAESIEQALTFTDEERELLAAARDQTHQLDEPGFYVLLRRVASLPRLSPDELSALASPAYGNLLEYPQRYRTRPVRLRIEPKLVKQLTPGKGLGRSKYWPVDRPVWRVDALNRGGTSPVDEPIIVFSVADPTPLLGEPTETAEDGRLVYKRNIVVQVAGVFYKVQSAHSRGSAEQPSELREYPVVLAWQVRRGGGTTSAFAEGTLETIIMVVAVVLLLILFLYMRRRTREQEEPHFTYRPRRESPGGEPDEEDEVDPALREAADDHRDDRTRDDADREG
jgi:hypothetical protein